jgi:beta-glucanase (GH16 family)
VTALAFAAAMLCACASPKEDDMFIPEGYELLWSDEFEGDSLNAAYWTPEQGGHGWGNNELQYYTGRKDNVDVRDGKLVIRAVKEDYNGTPVTSARLVTLEKVEFLYGYVVASIKLPKTADGLWPAFWMMGTDIRKIGWPNCGETDILEMGHSNGMKNGTQEQFLNGACHWGVPHHQYYAHDITNTYSVQDGEFHTFTCIWDEEHVAMYIDLEKYPDVKPYFEMKIEDFGNDEFRKDNFILLNLAVGGNFPGIWDINQVTALKDGPAEMEVDYVRIFQKVK